MALRSIRSFDTPGFSEEKKDEEFLSVSSLHSTHERRGVDGRARLQPPSVAVSTTIIGQGVPALPPHPSKILSESINPLLREQLGLELEYQTIPVHDLFLPFLPECTPTQQSISTAACAWNAETPTTMSNAIAPTQGSTSADASAPNAEIPAVSNIISLERFDCLRVRDEEETFFPKIRSLFVRQDMKRIMKRFMLTQSEIRNKHELARKFVLMGSPGIGKSLLFFLAAVWKATYRQQVVLYLCKSEDGPCSVFYMFRDGPNQLGVFFKRMSVREMFKKEKKIDLFQMVGPLLDAFQLHYPESQQPLLFVDGPKHHDKENTLDGLFDYLCTSGGYKLPSNEQNRYLRIWILEGWSKEDIVAALVAIHNVEKQEASDIYDVSGGCMRDASTCKTELGIKLVKEQLASKIKNLGCEEIELVNTKSENRNLNYNRLRMIFVIDRSMDKFSDLGNKTEFPDSKFVLNLLRQQLALSKYRHCYNEAIVIGSNLLQGVYYELYWHAWFEKLSKYGITAVRGLGSWEQSVDSLTKKNQYWFPEASNFPAIDAALVRGTMLYVFQYTVQSRKDDFNTELFMTHFLKPLVERKLFSVIKNIVILYVIPPTTGAFAVNRTSVTKGKYTFSECVVQADVHGEHLPSFPFFTVPQKASWWLRNKVSNLGRSKIREKS
jgi:hypothetical protein